MEGHYIDEFIRYSVSTHSETLIPIIRRMINSNIDKVAQRGAGWAAAFLFQYGVASDLFAVAYAGNVNHRKGIASQIAYEYSVENDATKCIDILATFFDDANKDVRAAAASVFQYEDIHKFEENSTLTHRFTHSRSFKEHADRLFYRLESFTGNLSGYASALFHACETLNAMDAKNNHDGYPGLRYSSTHLFKLILRLYESANEYHDEPLHEGCLAAINNLYEAGISSDYEIAKITQS